MNTDRPDTGQWEYAGAIGNGQSTEWLALRARMTAILASQTAPRTSMTSSDIDDMRRDFNRGVMALLADVWAPPVRPEMAVWTDDEEAAS